MNISGFIPTITVRIGMRLMSTSAAVNAVTAIKALTLSARNTPTMYTIVRIIFVRGSRRCRGELPGKYCPSVISFSISFCP